eukprot:6492695-Amphidinium_carterae.2
MNCTGSVFVDAVERQASQQDTAYMRWPQITTQYHTWPNLHEESSETMDLMEGKEGDNFRDMYRKTALSSSGYSSIKTRCQNSASSRGPVSL